MKMDYELYKALLGDVPKFLEKYLELDILERLSDISLLCGMDYASKAAYDFKTYVSRFDHSLNVALITWKLTQDKISTLAALFHDVASPVFSHVVDYMNGDFVNQESTEEKTYEILNSSDRLKKYLSEDGITVDDITDFKKYTVVDLERPKMCADRLDNIISVGMAWVGTLKFTDAKRIIDSMTITVNEYDEEEISFNDENVAVYVKNINDIINDYTHTNEDTYMMLLTADLLKRLIHLNIISYDELYTLTEHEIIEIIENNCLYDNELYDLWDKFKNIVDIPTITQPKIKNKIVNPLVNTRRLV